MDRIYFNNSLQLKEDKEFILSVAKRYDKALAYANTQIISDTKFILEILKINGACLAYLDEKFKDNFEVVSVAVKNKGKSLKFASERLKNNKTIVINALQKDGKALKYVSHEQKNDRDVILLATKGKCSLENIPKHFLENDKEIILQILNNKNSNYSLSIADEKIRNNKEVVLNAVRQNGLNLEFASEELKKDIEIVNLATKQNFFALQFTTLDFNQVSNLVSDYLKSLDYKYNFHPKYSKINNNKYRLIATIAKNINSWEFADQNYKSDKELLLFAIQINPLTYEYVCESLKYDRNIVITTIKNDFSDKVVFKYISTFCEKFKDDSEILDLISRQSNLGIKIIKNYNQWLNSKLILERWMIEIDTSFLSNCKSLYYPGAGYDFSTLQFFMENSGVNNFYYSDYMNIDIKHDTVLDEIKKWFLKFDYELENAISIRPSHFKQRNWNNFWHPNENARFGSNTEYSFISKFIISRGGKSWNLYYFGTEAIATYEILLKNKIFIDVIVTQDHGLGGLWTSFCDNSLLEEISVHYNMRPKFLFSGGGNTWQGYEDASDWFGKFGMHEAERKLYKLIE